MSEVVDTIPFAVGKDGIIRVSGTRVTLDTIIAAFQDGATPEQMAQQYPSVPLADLYQIIAFYLRHPADVDPYLKRRQRQAHQVRRKNEAQSPSHGIRERLISRRKASSR